MEMMKGWLRKLVRYKTIEQALNVNTTTISDKMQAAIKLWDSMFMDQAPWLDERKGIYSLNIAGQVCSELARSVTLEMNVNIHEPGSLEEAEGDDSKKINKDSRAFYLDGIIRTKVSNNLKEWLEHAMSVGGMILKPYPSNGSISVDMCLQGKFLPISFDDDGRLTDVAFFDTFTLDGKRYTKVERHRLVKESAENNESSVKVVIENKAYLNENAGNSSSPNFNDIGNEIPLALVPQWASITPEAEVKNVDRLLFGWYRVPKANNIDRESPLGVAVFSKATHVIERADYQYSRLDWEYEGGQMAIDVDPTAFKPTMVAGKMETPILNERLFRKVDLGQDKTYNAFTPDLRDESYLNGLNRYLMKIEDLCELSRGMLCYDNAGGTYTNKEHLIMNKQRFYSNVASNQASLENCLNDVIYAMNTYATLYQTAPEGEYETDFNWDDSIITDMASLLNEKLQLQGRDILGKDEIRAWYTGESLKTAQAKIAAIMSSKPDELNDIFTRNL